MPITVPLKLQRLPGSGDVRSWLAVLLSRCVFEAFGINHYVAINMKALKLLLCQSQGSTIIGIIRILPASCSFTAVAIS